MGCSVSGFDAESGTFTLKAEEGFAAGKIQLTVSFSDTDETVKLPLTVKTAQVKLKLDPAKLTLNKEIGDMASVGVTRTTKGYASAKGNATVKLKVSIIP